MESLQDKIHREQFMAGAGEGYMTRLTFVQADGAQTYSITTEQNIVIVSGHADNTMTITLPPVNEAAGRFIYIMATAGGTAQTTIADNGDDAGLTDIALDGNGEYAILYSTGEKWIEISTAGNA